MEAITFSMISIFITLILFSVMKNVFFNKNQLTKKIRIPYACFSSVYLLLIVLTYTNAYLVNNATRYMQIILSFIGTSLPIIFFSIRIDANDTSARNKWYILMEEKDKIKYKMVIREKEPRGVLIFYIISLFFNISAIIWFGTTQYNERIVIRVFLWILIILVFIFSFSSYLYNAIKLGSLIRSNLLYNYLFESLKENKHKNMNLFKFNKLMESLFQYLFEGYFYKKNKKINKQILSYIRTKKKCVDVKKK